MKSHQLEVIENDEDYEYEYEYDEFEENTIDVEDLPEDADFEWLWGEDGTLQINEINKDDTQSKSIFADQYKNQANDLEIPISNQIEGIDYDNIDIAVNGHTEDIIELPPDKNDDSKIYNKPGSTVSCGGSSEIRRASKRAADAFDDTVDDNISVIKDKEAFDDIIPIKSARTISPQKEADTVERFGMVEEDEISNSSESIISLKTGEQSRGFYSNILGIKTIDEPKRKSILQKKSLPVEMNMKSGKDIGNSNNNSKIHQKDKNFDKLIETVGDIKNADIVKSDNIKQPEAKDKCLVQEKLENIQTSEHFTSKIEEPEQIVAKTSTILPMPDIKVDHIEASLPAEDDSTEVIVKPMTDLLVPASSISKYDIPFFLAKLINNKPIPEPPKSKPPCLPTSIEHGLIASKTNSTTTKPKESVVEEEAKDWYWDYEECVWKECDPKDEYEWEYMDSEEEKKVEEIVENKKAEESTKKTTKDAKTGKHKKSRDKSKL